MNWQMQLEFVGVVGGSSGGLDESYVHVKERSNDVSIQRSVVSPKKKGILDAVA